MTPSENPTSSLAGKSIVTVEDEAITQLQLRKMLTRAGLRVIGQAFNGAEGVEMVLRERPDLVLMDVNMPILNGFDATRQIMQQWAACVVMLTAYSDAELENHFHTLGAQGYLVKPLHAETLLPALERVYAAHCAPK